MTLETWWLLVATVFVMAGTPGPNMLHVMSRSAEFGARRSLAAMAGCLIALLAVLTASAAGLTALLLAIPGAFEVLRYLGVAYLLYIGIKAWRAEVEPADPGDAVPQRRMSAAKLFRGGLAIGLSNPKIFLLVTAFLPQFIDPKAPQAPQFAIIIATLAAAELFWYVVYGLGGHSLSHYLSRPAIKRAFNRLTGGLFIGFGLALLRTRPA